MRLETHSGARHHGTGVGQIHFHGLNLSHLSSVNIHLLEILTSNSPGLGLRSDLAGPVLNPPWKPESHLMSVLLSFPHPTTPEALGWPLWVSEYGIGWVKEWGLTLKDP